jgi:YbbR domain-containing protein
LEGEKVKKFTMKKLFDNNRFVLVFAVAAALLLYAMVSVSTNDSRSRIIRNVPVTLDLQNATLVNQRLDLVDEMQYYVDIEVYGPLSEIDGLDVDSPELASTVRLDNIIEPGTYKPELESGYDEELPFEILEYSPKSIELTFDRQISKDFPIDRVINGVKTPPSYVLDGDSTSPESITVTGPQAEVARVDSVDVELELTEPLTAKFSDDLAVTLRDNQGNPIDPVEHHLTLSAATAQLVINVLKETRLPIEVEFLTPPRGFPVDELRDYMTLSADSLAVAGPETVIDTVTEIVLAYIDLKNLRLNDNTYNYSIGLEEDLDLRNLENISSVEVSFDASTWISAFFNISDVNVVSPPANYDVELLTSRIDNVEFIGLEDKINTLTADDIVAEINLAERELTPGQTTFPVKLSAPGKGMVWAVGDYSVMINVTEKAAE